MRRDGHPRRRERMMDDSGTKEEGMSTTETETTAAASTTPVSGERYVYSFGNGHADGQRCDEGRARRQGRGARRDDQRRRAGAAGLHHHHRRCAATTTRNGQLPAGLPGAAGRGARAARAHASASALGDAADPLLVSVRSGAKFSMPGMMDTILNLGLNDRSVRGLAAQDGQRPLRVGLLPALHPDVRRRW